MNKEEFLKLYKDEAVHCPTEELSNEFLELCDRFDVKCVEGNKATESNYWFDCKENTCYEINRYNEVQYGDINWFNKEEYEIIEFKSLKNLTGEENDK